MAHVYVSTVLDTPIDKVWEAVRDFGALMNWHPAVKDSSIEGGEPGDKVGCIRKLILPDGGAIREKLLSISDEERSFSYSILESPMPIENYVSTFRLREITDGGRTFAEWHSEFDVAPENEKAMVELVAGPIYQDGFDSLKVGIN
ncbi:MAG: SRPBCC family protein [bacterium]